MGWIKGRPRCNFKRSLNRSLAISNSWRKRERRGNQVTIRFADQELLHQFLDDVEKSRLSSSAFLVATWQAMRSINGN